MGCALNHAKQRRCLLPVPSAVPAVCWRAGSIPRLGRLNADSPDRLHLSAGEGDLDLRWPGLDALLVFAEPPWPADMQVYELASERIGPVMSPRFAGYERLLEAPASALCGSELPAHTNSRPQAWPSWAQQHGTELRSIEARVRFEHLYYLLEAAGLVGVIALQLLVAEGILRGSPGSAVGVQWNWRTWHCGLARRRRARSAAGAVAWLSCCANRASRRISHRACTAGKLPAGPVPPQRYGGGPWAFCA